VTVTLTPGEQLVVVWPVERSSRADATSRLTYSILAFDRSRWSIGMGSYLFLFNERIPLSTGLPPVLCIHQNAERSFDWRVSGTLCDLPRRTVRWTVPLGERICCGRAVWEISFVLTQIALWTL